MMNVAGKPGTYRVALWGILLVGIILGIWHNMLGVKSVWVFRNGEPLSSWIIIAAGPLSTLPATLLALFRRPWGAGWLIGGGLLSLTVVVLTEIASAEPVTEIASASLRIGDVRPSANASCPRIRSSLQAETSTSIDTFGIRRRTSEIRLGSTGRRTTVATPVLDAKAHHR